MILDSQKQKVVGTELKEVPKGRLGRLKERLLTRESLYGEFIKGKSRNMLKWKCLINITLYLQV